MTIAAGFLCLDGIIISADTCIVLSDGKKTDGPKIGTAHSSNGSYAIANSAEDGNAANTLAVKILKHLDASNLKTMQEVEIMVSDYMTEWWQAYGNQTPPNVQFILGSVIGGIPRLHICEPPNTVYQKSSYAAVGSGASTTDPLVATLFPGDQYGAKQRLWHIAYLFYRAKKDEAFCGGQTTPVYIPLDGREPIYISHFDMEEAEKFGPSFDFYLREILKARINSEDNRILETQIERLGAGMMVRSKDIELISKAFELNISQGL